MQILAVDTCLGACSVALLRGGAVIAHHHQAMERGHAEALAPLVRDATQDTDVKALSLLAVTVGPGTFTGQRVGLSFMRGLRLALGIPLIGLTSLEAMAAAAMAETGSRRAAAIHDARRGEAYLALVADDAMTMTPRVMDFAAAVEAIRGFGPCALAGSGAPAAQADLGDGFALSSIRQPDALFVAQLARRRPAPAPGAPPPAPLYLRAPDAKLPGGRELVGLFQGGGTALAALHAMAFTPSWDAASFEALLAGPGVFVFAAASGFVLARAVAQEAEILTVAVTPAARGRGLGRDLMRAAAAHAAGLGARTLFLEVGSDNPAALALYSGLGFRRAGTRKGYYATHGAPQAMPADALVLKAVLPLGGDLA